MNIKFYDNHNNLVEFRKIIINANNNISFKVFVNDKFKSHRYIYTSCAKDILTLINMGKIDFFLFHAMSQKYIE